MNRRHIRLILLICWLFLAGLIVWFKFVPLGQATYSLSYPASPNILGAKGFIGRFTPVDRVQIKSGELAKITGDPVYFSVFTPRTFSQAKVTITYQNNLTAKTPIISAGVLVDNIVWRYRLVPLENALIDNELASWDKLRNGDILLLQKNKKFGSVAEFLTALKNQNHNLCSGDILDCIAFYNTDGLASYLPAETLTQKIYPFQPIDIPLQGTHQFYFTYEANSKMDFAFDFTDLNLNKNSDPVVISIYKGEEKIFSQTIADGFGGESSGQVRNFSVPVSYQAPSSGLYKLEIKAGDDIVIKKINKAPSALTAIRRLRPVNVASLPISFWTDSSFILATTNNPASLQTLNFGGHNFSLSEAYRQFEFLNKEIGIKQVTLNHDDIILENDGVFSFAAEDFFNPEFKEIDRHFIINSDLEYVLAKYQTPQVIDNNFKQATVVLNTKEAYREKGKYSFMISVPGLSLENKGNLLISNIKVEFSGRTLWDKIKEKILSYVN